MTAIKKILVVLDYYGPGYMQDYARTHNCSMKTALFTLYDSLTSIP